MNDGFMFKLAQIRSSYTRKRFGTINNEEKALIDYETFCLELIKEIEKLQQENKELKEDVKSARSVYEGLLDKTIKYQESINKVIKLIEDTYYSKNTTDINSIVVSADKLIQIRWILKDSDVDD